MHRLLGIKRVMILDHMTEAMKLFKELTPENQANLLLYTKLAHTAEKSVKKSINRALNGEDAVSAEQKQECQ